MRFKEVLAGKPNAEVSRVVDGLRDVSESHSKAFLNQKRQHNTMILQHNCMGSSLKKHLEPARYTNRDPKPLQNSCMFLFTSTIYSLQKMTYSPHATLKSIVAGFVTPGVGKE